ncbi:hypothetical protein COE80_24690 [Bacillus pseudomycoides]|uniref:hypothetical protein n=1 Tax=Bacillus pseudomycoides TaxID=64104 RepID=UPI000BF28DC6|nr:hypothetical protein [Bacillus pseudomycoides]PGE94874.1 hypothetical protein COM62_22385 [Bacillus pseudomycoides]PHB19448.1 hypothetical protein COE80_24690 [Bacillus pseudomycoides]PHE36382.1 hypothetical protein COF51_21070 [Bacillus pseudomycoides]
MKQPVNFKWEHYEPDILIELLDKRIKTPSYEVLKLLRDRPAGEDVIKITELIKTSFCTKQNPSFLG